MLKPHFLVAWTPHKSQHLKVPWLDHWIASLIEKIALLEKDAASEKLLWHDSLLFIALLDSCCVRGIKDISMRKDCHKRTFFIFLFRGVTVLNYCVWYPNLYHFPIYSFSTTRWYIIHISSCASFVVLNALSYHFITRGFSIVFCEEFINCTVELSCYW